MTSTPSDFFIDPQNIIQLTSDTTYRLGLHDFKSNCVFECYLQDNQLLGKVESKSSELPYSVCINLNLQQNTIDYFSCYCEQEDGDEHLCRHGVATMLQYAQQVQEEQASHAFLSAKDSALRERVKSGKAEVKVKALNNTENFGHWRAESIVSATHRQQIYSVQIRSLAARQNLCTCPDWANNQLGTCKHIEAVLHYITRNKKTSVSALPSIPFIYRGWQDHQPVIRLQRSANMSPELNELLADYFDVKGDFSGHLPNDFFRLQNCLTATEAIQIGDDAVQSVQRMVSQQTRQLEKASIEQQFELTRGRIGGIAATLFPYQIEGAAFLAANGRALLADDMGLGKTLQAITAAYWLHKQAGVNRVLIVCPASLKSQWAREIAKFTGLPCQIIQGNAEQRILQYKRDSLFMIVNYEIILRDLEIINQQLAPDLLILDEAQRIKNWRTKIASSIKLIHSRYAFVLTGTPLENRLEDLYSLMQVVDPHVLGPLWRYLADFHISDDKGKVLGYRNLSELRRLIAPLMLRRNRSIVSDQLPSKTHTQLDISLSKRQRDLHDAAMSSAGSLADIAKRRPLTPSEQNSMMAALQQARMACDAAGLVDKKTQGSPKLDELRLLLSELCIDNGVKVVVFSQWHGMTKMVEALAKQLNIGSVHLHGGVPTAKRGELMERFQHDDNISLFISTDAGGTGLNLQSASVLINMDVPWNPAVLEQRNARVHRLGQSRNVQIILMVAANSYEERVLELISNKQSLFDNVVSSEASEDVVGVSKKTLVTLVEELQKKSVEPQALDPQESEPLIQAPVITAEPIQATETSILDSDNNASSAPLIDGAEDQQLKIVINALQRHFAARIEQILGKRGSLLVVLDQLNDEDENFINQLDSPVPIALIDTRNLKQLQKLQALSPLQDLQQIPLSTEPNVLENPWFKQAHQKLAAAKLLQQHGQVGSLDMLIGATCAQLTAWSEKPTLLTVENACLSLYTDSKLQEKLCNKDSLAISRLFSLREVGSLPEPLLLQLIDEVESLLQNVH